MKIFSLVLALLLAVSPIVAKPKPKVCRLCPCGYKMAKCIPDCAKDTLCAMACSHGCKHANSGDAKPYCPYAPKLEK